jgi:hypothetical protein
MTSGEFEQITGKPLENFYHQCHTASIALVRAGYGKRVLRGWHPKVGGQHSWVLLAGEVYDTKARIADPTLWSYTGQQPEVWTGLAHDHRPHGAGSIWEDGKPVAFTHDYIKLTPKEPLSDLAQTFLGMIEPLDRRGWSLLVNGAMEGWPAGEIIAAMVETPQLMALVPIDRIGMLTDLNPGGLYLKS